MRVRRLFVRAPLSSIGVRQSWLSPAARLAQDAPSRRRPRIEAEDQIVLAGHGHRCRTESGSARSSSSPAAWTVNGVVTGDVVVLEGPVTVTGQVNGSVIAADGIVRLAESARVGGDVLASEPILIRPGAEVARGDARRGPVLASKAPWPRSGSSSGPSRSRSRCC